MGKKTADRHPPKPAFRESDFAGMPAKDQLDLSGSLNQLSQQLDATRKLLQDIEISPPVVPASAALAEKTPPIPLSDDDAVTHG